MLTAFADIFTAMKITAAKSNCGYDMTGLFLIRKCIVAFLPLFFKSLMIRISRESI